MSNKQIVVTIAGPSTSGKSTLANLFKPEGYQEIVSTTTRPQRTGEINGIHYHFVDSEIFNKMIVNNELVEHAPVGKYLYGVSKKAIQDVLLSGNSAVLVLEPNGIIEVAKFCEQNNIENYKVFINNPIELLIQRLHERYNNDEKRNDDVYKDRLWNIGFIEPREWTAKAYNGQHHYDAIFNSFNPENQNEVLKTILLNIQKKLNNNMKRKP